jgi:hypothetical protein
VPEDADKYVAAASQTKKAGLLDECGSALGGRRGSLTERKALGAKPSSGTLYGFSRTPSAVTENASFTETRILRRFGLPESIRKPVRQKALERSFNISNSFVVAVSKA